MHKHDSGDHDSNNNTADKVDTSRKEATPLLAASLNSPPVAISISANGSVDLSSHMRTKRPNDDQPGHSPSSSSSPCSKEMYANLLMQLRHQGITASEEIVVNTTKISAAAARKEKLKSQLCFQCPVCKKRFQRHIAMNAHFQAEHVGSSAKNDKICKLCSYVGHDMGAIRTHLLTKHNIDLETPTACLVEPEVSVSPSSSSPSCSSRSNTSSPLPSSSSDKKSSNVKHYYASNNNNNNNSAPAAAVSIIRTSIVPKSEEIASSSTTSGPYEQRSSPPVNVVIHETSSYISKQELNGNADNAEEAKDLSIKRSTGKRCASPLSGCLDLAQNSNKRLKSVNGNRIVMSSPSSPLNHQQEHTSFVASTLTSQWQCQHCSIIFPDQTLYFLHRGFHSNTNPWKCNGCGQRCTDMYDFNTHLMSDVHH